MMLRDRREKRHEILDEWRSWRSESERNYPQPDQRSEQRSSITAIIRRALVYSVGSPKYWSFWAIGFGTNLWLLALVILVLALVSYPLYRHPFNIEPSLARLAGAPTRELPPFAWPYKRLVTENTRPDWTKWSVWDALWLTARTHIPLISLAVRDEWELRDEPGFHYDLSAFPFWERCKDDIQSKGANLHEPLCSKYDYLNLSPQDLAGIMMVLNWILWPLLLAFLVPRLLRRGAS
jgi:hypothetical protein